MTAPARRADVFAAPLSGADWGGRVTRAEVNLDAIAHNVRELKRAVCSSELMVVVKANGYGHGATQVARAAITNGATWLAVYTPEEGLALRADGISERILVLGPFRENEARRMVACDLTATVSKFESGRLLSYVAEGALIPFHLELDTGLSRAGIAPRDAPALLNRLRAFPSLSLEGVFSHFATADEQDTSTANRQLRIFLETCDALEQAGHTFRFQHLANSAAALAFADSHFSLIRCGISTYGYYPSPCVPHDVVLRPALSLLSTIIGIHELPRGAGVGYGHEFVTTRQARIALVPIGYGDGLPRTLGLGAGLVIVRGQRAPIVGRMSMDQITVDVTDIADARAGDTVTIIGADGSTAQDADEVAGQAGTISYDILTGLLPRVPRLYVHHGKLAD